MKTRTSLSAGMGRYTVMPNDDLSTIAIKYYGPNVSWEKVMQLYAINSKVIGPDPNIIQPGMVLRIPR